MTWLRNFVDNFVLKIDGERIKFNKQRRMPRLLTLKHEMSDPTSGPLYQEFANGDAVPAFKHTRGEFKGMAVWMSLKDARNIGKIAGLSVEVR